MDQPGSIAVLLLDRRRLQPFDEAQLIGVGVREARQFRRPGRHEGGASAAYAAPAASAHLAPVRVGHRSLVAASLVAASFAATALDDHLHGLVPSKEGAQAIVQHVGERARNDAVGDRALLVHTPRAAAAEYSRSPAGREPICSQPAPALTTRPPRPFLFTCGHTSP